MAPNIFILFSFIVMLLFVQCYAEQISFSDNQKTSPFEFINTLEESQKGAKVKDLNKLKKYLRHFGYLSDSYKVQTRGKDDDHFDDVLESAIKTYQVNYNLNATGTLDAETISNMMLPRCGFPDIVNGETRMRSGRGKTRLDHHVQNKKDHTVSNYTIFDGRPRWPSSSLSYGFVNSGWQVPFVNNMDQAFRRWAISTGRFTFTRINDGANANIKIGVFRRAHGDEWPFDGPGGYLAHAWSYPRGTLHFDQEDNFSFDYPGPNQHHLESVAVHEIGHNLGLDHSSDPRAIMYPTIPPGTVKVDLTSDDLAGINDLYS